MNVENKIQRLAAAAAAAANARRNAKLVVRSAYVSAVAAGFVEARPSMMCPLLACTVRLGALVRHLRRAIMASLCDERWETRTPNYPANLQIMVSWKIRRNLVLIVM